MADQPFTYRHRVTYSDCTLGDHVYYSRFLDILEAARGEFFRHRGISALAMQQQDCILPVVECRVRYKALARYDDLLDVQLWVSAAEGVRVDFSYRITNQCGALVLQAETRHACTGIAGKLKRLPNNVRQALAPPDLMPASSGGNTAS